MICPNDKFCKLLFTLNFGKKVDIRKTVVLNYFSFLFCFKQALKTHLFEKRLLLITIIFLFRRCFDCSHDFY